MIRSKLLLYLNSASKGPSVHRFLKRLKARWGPAFASDTDFIESAFLEILGRSADLDGLTHYRRVLREGLGRTAVLLEIMRSEESTSKLRRIRHTLPDLRRQRPDRYRDVIDRSNGQTICVFDTECQADFDWLEDAILKNGYYEEPGVWTLGIDADKRIIAEIIASFGPQLALELGCAAGAVLECLQDLRVSAEGVEISSMALQRASDRVRGSIRHGDLLSLTIDRSYDVVFGLDVFEHLNPNRIGAYVSRLAEITRDGGYLFCNIPMFGEDPVFGTVFPLYVDEWKLDAEAARPFSAIHVDELGYPIHGHLTWATAAWWVSQFTACDLHREFDIERALHSKYDSYMERRAPGRKPYLVFSKNTTDESRTAVISAIGSQPMWPLDGSFDSW